MAEAALAEFRDRACRLRQDYDEAGGAVAERLRDAMGIAPNEPGLFGRMAEGLGDAMDSLRDGLADLHDAVIGFLAALKNPSVISAATSVVLGRASVVLSRAAGPSMATVKSMASPGTLGFAMRPAGTYLSSGVTSTMRVKNALTGGSHLTRLYGTAFNAEGNHLGRLTGVGVDGSLGPFSVGDPNGGGFSGFEVRDHYTADRNEVGQGALGAPR